MRWTWGSSGHSTTSGSPGQPNGIWDSGIRNQGATFTRTFNSAGTFPYYCTPHGGCCAMVGTVTVVNASPTPSPTPMPTANTLGHANANVHARQHQHSQLCPDSRQRDDWRLHRPREPTKDESSFAPLALSSLNLGCPTYWLIRRWNCTMARAL